MKKIVILLLVALPFVSFSQNNVSHEYLSITLTSFELKINVNSEPYKVISVKSETARDFYDQRPLLMQMEKFEEEGWELVAYNSNAASFFHVTVLMRRKK